MPGTRSGISWSLGIGRDSLDKRLGSIRERVRLENYHQLLRALADVKNPANQNAGCIRSNTVTACHAAST